MKFLITSKTVDGGIARHAYEVADYLHHSTEHQVRVIIPGENDLSEEYSQSGIDVAKIPEEKYYFKTKTSNPLLLIWNAVVLKFFLLQELRDFHPDYVYCAEWFPCTLSAIGAKIVNSHDVVTIVHGAEVLYLPEDSIFKKIMKPVQKWAFQKCTKVYGVSEFTADNIRQLGVQNIGVCYNGINPDRFSYNPDADIDQVQDSDLVLLTISRLQKYKGHDVVIQAMSELIDDYPNIHYLIAGTGEDRDEIEDIAKESGVLDSITFLGYVPGEELSDLYSRSDIFVMPTRISGKGLEGFGIAYLEAYLCQTPVIGTTEGGADSVIEHGKTGYLADPRDAKDVKKYLRILLNNPEDRNLMAERGDDLVHAEFTWDIVVKNIINDLESAESC